jgi:hypothetical protein
MSDEAKIFKPNKLKDQFSYGIREKYELRLCHQWPAHLYGRNLASLMIDTNCQGKEISNFRFTSPSIDNRPA